MNRSRKLTRSIRFLVLVAAGLFTMSIIGCIALIPVAVMYYEKNQGYLATAQVPLPVDEIYKTALKQAEEPKDKNVKILNKDDAKHIIEVTDGVQKATFEAKELDAKNSVITVMASVPEKKDVKDAKEEKMQAEKELALQIVTNLCKAANVECTVVKKDEKGEDKK